MHGDVKAKNFVLLSSGAYAAIDLDAAGLIDPRAAHDAKAGDGPGDCYSAGAKETSTAYVPPEQARVLRERHRPRRTADYFETEKKRLDNGLSQVTEQIQNEPADNYDKQDELTNKKSALLKEMRALIRERNCGEKDIPAAVAAAASYDLWCFGVLLYHMSTAAPLFPADDYDNIQQCDMIETLDAITEWDGLKGKKLSAIPEGWPRDLIEKLLDPDCEKRPPWSEVIADLEQVRTGHDETQQLLREQHAEMLGAIHTLEKKLYQKIDGLQGLLLDLRNVTCPYLFEIVDITTLSEAQDLVDLGTAEAEEAELDRRVGMAQRLYRRMRDKVVFVKRAYDDPVGAIQQMLMDRKSIKLQLLCGVTLKPVVVYKMVAPAHEEVGELAEKLVFWVKAGLLAAALWNCVAAVAEVVGYHARVRTEKAKKVEEMLDSLSDDKQIKDLLKAQESGMDLTGLHEFAALLEWLESKDGGECGRLCGDNTDKPVKWEDHLFPHPGKDGRLTFACAEQTHIVGGSLREKKRDAVQTSEDDGEPAAAGPAPPDATDRGSADPPDAAIAMSKTTEHEGAVYVKVGHAWRPLFWRAKRGMNGCTIDEWLIKKDPLDMAHRARCLEVPLAPVGGRSACTEMPGYQSRMSCFGKTHVGVMCVQTTNSMNQLFKPNVHEAEAAKKAAVEWLAFFRRPVVLNRTLV